MSQTLANPHPEIKPGATIGCGCERCLANSARINAMDDEEFDALIALQFGPTASTL